MTVGARQRVAASEQQALVNAHFEAAATYWRAIYRSAEVPGAIYQDRRAAVLALADRFAPRPSSILEIGCGSGSTAVALAQRGHRVHAVDTVRAMLDLTSALAREAGVAGRVTAILGDVHRLHFLADAFDLVLAIGVTPWLHALAAPLDEMRRVMRPGGHLIITADNRWRLNHLVDPRWLPALAPLRSRMRRAVERLGGRAPRRPRLRMHSPGEFDRALSRAGLLKVCGRTLGFGPFSFLGCPLLPAAVGVCLHHRLQRLADRGVPLIRSTGAQYIVVTQKVKEMSKTEKEP